MTNGKRGPRPAPTALKVVKGERSDRIARNEPRPDPSPDVPAPLHELSDEAQLIWDRLAPQLHRKGVLTDWDIETFGVYVEAVVEWRHAVARVNATGVLVKGERGMVKNPALQIVKDQAAVIRGYAQEFGLTPSARSGIELPKDEEMESARRLLS